MIFACLIKHECGYQHCKAYVRLSFCRLETDIQNLEQHLEAMRATYQLNTEKLEYNYRVLVRDAYQLGASESLFQASMSAPRNFPRAIHVADVCTASFDLVWYGMWWKR